MPNHRVGARLPALAILLVLAGCGPTSEPLEPQTPSHGSPAAVAAPPSPLARPALDDALGRLIPRLDGPGVDTLSGAIRGLATALAFEPGPAIRLAADSARSVIRRFEAQWHEAADLEAIRLAIAAADPTH